MIIMKDWEKVIGIILVVLIIIVLLKFLIEYKSSLNNIDVDCAGQVALSASLTELTKNRASPPIDCPTRVLHIDKNTENPNLKIATHMKKCWDQWQYGDRVLFKQKEGVFCHLCSYIDFEDVQLDNFGNYLSTKVPGKDYSWSTYFQPHSVVDWQDNIINKQLDYDFDTSQDYGVIFVYMKGANKINETFYKLSQSNQAYAEGFVIGGAVGAGVLYMTVCGVLSGGLCLAVVGGGALVTGIATGYFSNYFADELPETAGLIRVIPLTRDEINKTGCLFTPVD